MATIHGLFLKFTKKERLSSHFLRVRVFLSFFFFFFSKFGKKKTAAINALFLMLNGFYALQDCIHLM